MAQAGATFREILEHYYPNTQLVNRFRKDKALEKTFGSE